MRKVLGALVVTMALLVSGGHESFAASSTYTIQEGDTLYQIARENNLSVATLKSINALTSNLIFPQQVVKLTDSTNTPSRGDSSKVVKEFTASATAYTANCNGCSGITKTGINLNSNSDLKVIAVDPSVIKLGSKVWVEGYGYAIAGDIGSAIKGNKIDVFIPTKGEAYKWGRKNVKIKVFE